MCCGARQRAYIMADLAFALQDAVFDKLSAAIGLPLAAVHQHVPDGTQPPVVIIGRFDVQNESEKVGELERISFEVECFYRGPGRKGLFAIMAAVKAALKAQQLDPSAANIEPPSLIAPRDQWLQDGITYYRPTHRP